MVSRDQYRALREGAGLVNRSSRGRLRLTGRDRREYLQGLLTNDIVALSAGSGCYACLLTAQGRMIADMYVVETGEAVLMDLEGHLSASVGGHLERFVFSEDVEVSDVSASVAQLGVFGPRAALVVSRVIGSHVSAPLAPDAAVLEGMGVLENRSCDWGGAAGIPLTPLTVVRRDDLGARGFDLVVAAAYAADLSRAIIDAGAVAVDSEVAEVCRVESGRPVFGKDMTTETIPLEAGIEDRAISLTKGCYVGQEIIIRVLHRGQGRVAKRLVGLTFDHGAGVPVRGSVVRGGDRDIGAVTSAVWSPAMDRPIAMGYVHRDFVEAGTAVMVAAGDEWWPGVVARLPFVRPTPETT
jgi:tRNA-modifying protein YgfZ